MARRAVVAALAACAAGAAGVGCGGARRAAVESALSTRLAIHVTDGEDGHAIGARVLLTGPAGPLSIGQIDLFGTRQGSAGCALAPGTTGTVAGIVVPPRGTLIRVGSDRCVAGPAIPFGVYRVRVWHGIDHEAWEGTVDLRDGQGEVTLDVALERAWTAKGALAADLHVHAVASDDSVMPNAQRVLAQVAAGIQVIGLTNHNAVDDAEPAIRQLHLEDTVAAIPGIELTTARAHVSVYPVPTSYRIDPASIEDLEPDALLAIADGITGQRAPIVQINHPRFRVNALFDYYGWNTGAWPPPFPLGFTAVEVFNGFTAFDAEGDRRMDESVDDLYRLTDHGKLVAAMGNSDTHDYNWVADGLARTLVFVPSAVTRPFDENAFIEAIRARHTEATTGPYLQVAASAREGGPAVGPGEMVAVEGGAGAVWLDVTVSTARFAVLDRLRVTVGTPRGARVMVTVPLVHGQRETRWSGRVEVGAADTWIGVAADGDTPLPLAQTGTYQRDKWKRAGNTPYAVISPILVDADGDGHWRRGDAR